MSYEVGDYVSCFDAEKRRFTAGKVEDIQPKLVKIKRGNKNKKLKKEKITVKKLENWQVDILKFLGFIKD